MAEEMEKQFNVGSRANLSVSNIRGSVEIRSGEAGLIQVKAVKRSNSGDENRTEIEIAQETDGSVRVVTHFPDVSWNWLGGVQPCEVDYEITAPPTCSLTLKGVSNSVHAEGFEAAVSVVSVSGEIYLRNIKGSTRIKTVSGDAKAELISGALILDTVSADMEIKESAMASIEANSVSGDLRIHTTLAQGPYMFNSVSGDVCLIVPPESRFTANLSSLSGDLMPAFPITCGSHKFGSQMVQIQGGGVIVTMHSVSGDLTFDRDGDAAFVQQPVATDSMEARRAVLERLDRGEMTVAEVLDHLRA